MTGVGPMLAGGTGVAGGALAGGSGVTPSGGAAEPAGTVVIGNEANNTTPRVVPLPAGAAAGDLVVYMLSGEVSGQWNLSAGWTTVGHAFNNNFAGRTQAVARILDGTTGNNVLTITSPYSSGNRSIIGFRVASGLHAAAAVSELRAAVTTSGVSGNANPPLVAGRYERNHMWVAAMILDAFGASYQITGMPSGYAELAKIEDASNGHSTAVAWLRARSPFADPGTFTNANRGYAALALAIPVAEEPDFVPPVFGDHLHFAAPLLLTYAHPTPALPPGAAAGDLVVYAVHGSRSITAVTPNSLSTWWWLDGAYETSTATNGTILARVLDGTAADAPPTLTFSGGGDIWVGSVFHLKAGDHAVSQIADLAWNGLGSTGQPDVPIVVGPGGFDRKYLSVAQLFADYASAVTGVPAGYNALNEIVLTGAAGRAAWAEVDGSARRNPGTFTVTYGAFQYYVLDHLMIPLEPEPIARTWSTRVSPTAFGNPVCPRYVEAGDVLLLEVVKGGYTTWSTIGPGFTQLSTTNRLEFVAYKVAAGTEGGTTITLSGGGPTTRTATVTVIKGLDTADLNVVHTEGAEVSASPIPLPAHTPGDAPAVVFSRICAAPGGPGGNENEQPAPTNPFNNSPVLNFKHPSYAGAMAVWAAEVDSTLAVPAENITDTWASWRYGSRTSFRLLP